MDKTARVNVAYGFLVVYVLYALFNIGMVGLLFSFAIGLIVFSFNLSMELTAAIIILSGLVYKLFMDRRRREGFQAPLGAGQSPEEIRKKIAAIQNNKAFEEPSGVLSSDFVEGFEDANQAESKKEANGDVPPEAKTEEKGVSANGSAASTDAPAATEHLKKDLPANSKTAEAVASGFADKGTDGMFKLGSIPSDAVGGSHIDIGTTMMNALNSLKPDQIKQMTNDTKQLLETQKSLMGMLNTMKPMLQDGKQLMETFGQMFPGK